MNASALALVIATCGIFGVLVAMLIAPVSLDAALIAISLSIIAGFLGAISVQLTQLKQLVDNKKNT